MAVLIGGRWKVDQTVRQVGEHGEIVAVSTVAVGIQLRCGDGNHTQNVSLVDPRGQRGADRCAQVIEYRLTRFEHFKQYVGDGHLVAVGGCGVGESETEPLPVGLGSN